MLSFSTFAVLAIAAQSLFVGVDAAVLPKRQSLPSSPDLSSLLDQVIGLLGSLGGAAALKTVPFNVDTTYGVDGQGGDQFGGTLQQLIPVAVDGLANPGGNVSVTGVSGQSPFSIGLGFFPVNGTNATGFDPTSIFSQISDPLCDIISSVLGGNFTAFPMPFPGVGGNSTLPGFGGSPPLPGSNGTTPAARGAPNATIPIFGTPTTVPTNNPTILSSPVPSSIGSSVGPLPTNVTTSAGPLTTDVSTSLPTIPTVVPS